MKKYICPVIAAVSAVAGSAVYYRSFVKWVPVLYGLSVLLFAVSAGLIAANFAVKKPVLKGTVTALIYAGMFAGLTFLVNNVILHASQAKKAGLIISLMNLVFFILFYLIHSRNKQKKKMIAFIAFLLSIIISAGEIVSMFVMPEYHKAEFDRVSAPVAGVKIPEKRRELVKNADFYVSAEGNDENDGSFSAPFLTLEKAVSTVRSIDKSGKKGITVAIKAGDYRVDSLVFGRDDSGTKDCPITYCAYGDGEVVINGGATLRYDKFERVSDKKQLERLNADAREKVRCVDLTQFGITRGDYGKIYAVGSYNTAAKYDGDYVGDIYCELFVNDSRMTLARYPDGNEYLHTGEVIEEGEGRESNTAQKKEGFDKLRNPKPDIYKMSKELSERIKSWASLDDVWMFGYWRYDWADASSPVGEVDHGKMTLSPRFVSTYGAVKDAPYYFFNVFEELTAPGEWYLDRESGILYLYPPEDFGEDTPIDISLSTGNIVKVDNASFLTFDGLTFKGTRGDAISITGDSNTVKNCLIKNVSGNALTVTGYDNIAADNEITRTGKGGIIINGGDIETLRPGNNIARNNLIHDWSEIYETYQPAFYLNGTGNICSHNEIYNSPHEAISYSGNNHIIEYNLIHDVCLLSDDAGAIYSGRRWDWYGNVIRYNCIYNIGSGEHKPAGIYMDDALSGQEVYGNLLINVPHIGIQLGGGRDLIVHDNVVVNSELGMTYDDRALTGLPGNENSNFHEHYKEGGGCWQLLYDSPWKSEAWQKAFPQMTHFSDDFGDTDNPDFVLNPAYSTVNGNIFITPNGKIGDISEAAYKYSGIDGNYCCKLTKLETLFKDPANGDYTLLDNPASGFRPGIPDLNEFGRQP